MCASAVVWRAAEAARNAASPSPARTVDTCRATLACLRETEARRARRAGPRGPEELRRLVQVLLRYGDICGALQALRDAVEVPEGPT